MSLSAGWWTGAGPPDYTDIKQVPDFSGASEDDNAFTADDGVAYNRARVLGCGFMSAVGGSVGYDLDENNKTGSKEGGQLYVTEGTDATDFNGYESMYVSTPISGYYTGKGTLAFPFFASGTVYATARGAAWTRREFFVWTPDCWLGKVAEVTGSILMYIGLATEYIDMTAWSDTDTGQGTYGGGSDEIIVFYKREPGQTYGDTLKALTAHSWDILSITMGGKIGLYRRVGAASAYVIASLDGDDGVISVQWRYAYEHLGNSSYVGYGTWMEHKLDWLYVTGFGTVYPLVRNETTVRAPMDYVDAWKEYTAAASVTKYGEKKIGKLTAKYYTEGELQEQAAYYLPYLSQETPAAGAAVAEAARDNYMDRIDVDSQLRREVTVVQDFRGLDYDVGYRVEDVAVTADGVTIGAMVCIKKTINFNDFTVTSVLLEEPS